MVKDMYVIYHSELKAILDESKRWIDLGDSGSNKKELKLFPTAKAAENYLLYEFKTERLNHLFDMESKIYVKTFEVCMNPWVLFFEEFTEDEVDQMVMDFAWQSDMTYDFNYDYEHGYMITPDKIHEKCKKLPKGEFEGKYYYWQV